MTISDVAISKVVMGERVYYVVAGVVYTTLAAATQAAAGYQ
jgi:hypothetical protein